MIPARVLSAAETYRAKAAALDHDVIDLGGPFPPAPTKELRDAQQRDPVVRLGQQLDARARLFRNVAAAAEHCDAQSAEAASLARAKARIADLRRQAGP